MDAQIDVKSGNSLNGTDLGDPIKKISLMIFFNVNQIVQSFDNSVLKS